MERNMSVLLDTKNKWKAVFCMYLVGYWRLWLLLCFMWPKLFDNLKIYFSQKLHFSLNVSLLRFVKILNQIFELQCKYARIWHKGESRCGILQTRLEIFPAILSLFSLRRGLRWPWLPIQCQLPIPYVSHHPKHQCISNFDLIDWKMH
jgi:hypothetical protein